MSVRVRFAPSPTGYLHIGGARTALFNWVLAQKFGGQYILRIEDTDPERSKIKHEHQIIADLNWMNLHWHEGPNVGGAFGPYRQSERFDRYNEVLELLIENGSAYRCTATPDELELLRDTQRANGEKPMYDNRYRDAALGPDCGPHVIRLRTPLQGQTEVNDLIKGLTVFQNNELDDFILKRSDGTPTYNFVVVVDDIDMQITHVVRGDDHLNNTPKQVILYNVIFDALKENNSSSSSNARNGTEDTLDTGKSSSLPKFAHVPMILGDDGKRLSKRHGATAVGMYRDQGYLPEGLFNYLARLGWACGDLELFTPEEMVSVFDFSQINRAGAKWDMDKLGWCNQQWIMRLELDDLAERCKPFFSAAGIDITSLCPDGINPTARYLNVIREMQPRAQTLVELVERSSFFFVAEPTVDTEAESKSLTPAKRQLLEGYLALLSSAQWSHLSWDAETLQSETKNWIKEHSAEVRAAGGKKVKIGALLFPLRIAISGRKDGPGVFETAEILGQHVTINRLKAAINKIELAQ